VRLGYALGIRETTRILDLCCGYGEMLRLLSGIFGCSGVGVDISKEFIEEGTKRITESGLLDRVSLVNGDAREWKGSDYDIACLVGEQDVFEGFENTLNKLFERVNTTGRVVIGTPYYQQPDVPKELVDFEGELPTELEVFDIVRSNHCVITFIGRDTRSEWDKYISWSARRHLESYRNEKNAQTKAEMYEWMHRWHEIYLRYRMRYEGWAMYAIERI